MNWLVIIVILFFVINIIIGFKKGLLKSIVTIGGLILALYLASHGYHFIAKGLNSIGDIENKISQSIVKTMEINTQEAINTKAQQINTIEGINVPESIKTAILDNNNRDVYEGLGVTEFYEYIAHYIAHMIINALSYIITVLIIFIIIMIIFRGTIEFIDELPVINGLDKIGGMLLGLIKAILDVWMLCIVITIIGSSGLGKVIFEQINQSAFLSYIYNNNLLLELVTDITKSLF